MMNPRFPSFDNIGRNEFRQVLEPETGSLGFAMSEHPWLDNLIGLANATADDADGVLDGYSRIWARHQIENEAQGAILFFLFALEPSRAADRQMCAGRVRYHQLPIALVPRWPVESFPNVALNMVFITVFCRKQIVRPSVMSTLAEGATDHAAELTGDQDSQPIPPTINPNTRSITIP